MVKRITLRNEAQIKEIIKILEHIQSIISGLLLRVTLLEQKIEVVE